ncbi:Transcription factor GTE8 [Dichanthelium oligosanthes]|uniref:Transcription factor GTE8 n=1 Tax=Dichanthelium oligosanthes TaxID=888268 RepID=A0A1E5US15_9POAL|nr:Transcription factor GTE8 [Dichanthelium oligosanthes]
MMGKTHRFSKGHPLGFVPDYRHGVETVGESKGLGSPSRIDSGSSCAPPKRKCVSVNSEEGEGASGLFNVRREVFSLPRMTALDKKELEMKLRDELAQVRALQNRLFSRVPAISMNGGAESAPGGDVHPKKKVDKLKRSSSVQSDRGVPPPVAVASPVASSVNYTTSFKQCGNLLKSLMTHIWAHPFVAPVDVVQLRIPDYFDIVKQPMDLGTIQKKMNAGMYSTPHEFAADVRLTFSNAMNYNPVNNDVHVMAKTLNKTFENRWRLIEKKLPRPDEKLPRPDEKPPQPDEKPPQPDEKPPVREPAKKNSSKRDAVEKEDPVKKKPSKKSAPKQDIFQEEDPVDNPVLQPKKRKTSPLVSSPLVQDAPLAQDAPLVQDAPLLEAIVPTGKTIMTSEQKYELSARLQSYGALIPDHVVEFIRSHADDCGADEDELELDMDALGDDTLFELQKLLDDYDRVNLPRNLTEEDPHEVESRSQYELINPSVCHEEGNELVDEDVDIGENDPPVSTLPPVVFEVETADRSSKHSTSSSSSSDSESSSSDSDSSSSSGSDTDAKALPHNSGLKENVLPVASLDQEKGSLNTLNLPEQSTDPISVTADGEGENVSEKQVSPEKQIRAALLKSRFADTILKAQEKALDQATKKDPEKIRREREELERAQRQARARLEAEAKAAEDARKRAEAAAAAEAAAEAKRQRELEREAARKALQEMEKTVDINEGSHFLKDLEMLGSVTGEQIPNYVGEMSPMPDSLGFQMGGNPLEKLGLYMKNDEDDDEGDFTDEPAVDVEEGEID